MNETVETADENGGGSGKVLTGRKVFFMFVAFFGVMLVANLTLMFKAIGTFPGLEVRNSYIASQKFDELAVPQRALGWTPDVKYLAGELVFSISDQGGQFVVPPEMIVRIGRPTHVEDDQVLVFEITDGIYQTAIDLDFGSWRLFVDGVAADGTQFSYRMEIYVPRGD